MVYMHAEQWSGTPLVFFNPFLPRGVYGCCTPSIFSSPFAASILLLYPIGLLRLHDGCQRWKRVFRLLKLASIRSPAVHTQTCWLWAENKEIKKANHQLFSLQSPGLRYRSHPLCRLLRPLFGPASFPVMIPAIFHPTLFSFDNTYATSDTTSSPCSAFLFPRDPIFQFPFPIPHISTSAHLSFTPSSLHRLLLCFALHIYWPVYTDADNQTHTHTPTGPGRGGALGCNECPTSTSKENSISK